MKQKPITLVGYDIPHEYLWGGTNCFWCGRSVIYAPRGGLGTARGALNRKRLRAQELYQATREHLIPKAFGGNHKNNIVVACKRCNNTRGIEIGWQPHHMKLTPAAKVFLKFLKGQMNG